MPSQIDDDAVGYKKPPKHTRFRAGKSGNPGGRSKRETKFLLALAGALKKKRKVRVGARTCNIGTLEAILLVLRTKALEGDRAASRIVARIEGKSQELQKEYPPKLIFQYQKIDPNAEEVREEDLPLPKVGLF